MTKCPKAEHFHWHLTRSGTYRAYRCESLRCPVCARAASDRLAAKIGSWAAERKLRRFWTFTLDPSRIPGVTWTGAPLSVTEVHTAVAYLRKLWNKYLTAWRRDDAALEYIAVLELQKSGAPHLHVLVNGWYSWARMAARWRRMGGGSHVRVNGVRGGAEGVTRYMSKYMSKSLPGAAPDLLEDGAVTYDGWPARTRHHTCSQSIHLQATAAQWSAACVGLWRDCFPHLMNVRNASALCRGCVYRRLRTRDAPRPPGTREPGEDAHGNTREYRAMCPGMCEKAELVGANGPVGRRRRHASRFIVFDASPEWVDLEPNTQYLLGAPKRLIPGRFADRNEPDAFPAERFDYDYGENALSRS